MRVAGGARRRKEPNFPSERDPAAPAPGRPDPSVLLAWYDHHRRALPWRSGPGERPDPYRVWLSEIMLQQTTVKAVAPYYLRFLHRFPTVERLAAAPLDDVLKAWAGLGYYARGRNLHACARAVVERHGGRFPDSEEALRKLPGIGTYTAAAIAAIAFDRPAVAVDGNVERVIARLHAIDQPLPAAKPLIWHLAQALTPQHRPGDFAQAMMDLGATICTPKQPACILCPWNEPCAARARGEPALFPRKAPKTERRLRRGAAFVVVRADGWVLLRTRPQHGLLGGMTEVPTTPWSEAFDARSALAAAPRLISPRRNGKPNGSGIKWRRTPGVVTHTFTHFPLELVVYVATVALDTRITDASRWVALGQLGGEALPNVMRKVLAHALDRGRRVRPGDSMAQTRWRRILRLDDRDHAC
jgi:A/G-specific adenine glycosylase